MQRGDCVEIVWSFILYSLIIHPLLSTKNRPIIVDRSILYQQHEPYSLSLSSSLKPYVFLMLRSRSCLQTSSNALTTFWAVLADVSKYIYTPACFIHSSAYLVSTSRLHPTKTTLLRGRGVSLWEYRWRLVGSFLRLVVARGPSFKRSAVCIEERVPGDIVDEDYCMRVTIEGFHEGMKSLLASSVPKLELDADIILICQLLSVYFW